MLNKKSENGRQYIFCYHTQEHRENELNEPICCNTDRAWLGTGYYFWLEEKFAHYWGRDSKTKTGNYDVYTCWVDSDGLINATFDEKGYYFWKDRIEKAIQTLKDAGLDITLAKVHEFLADVVWERFGVKGIIYDDIPQNPGSRPKRVYSEIPPLYYEKRIQLVIFNKQHHREFTTLERQVSCT